MTREEARQRALNMPRLKMLIDVRDSMEAKEWYALDICLADGKVPVGNPEVVKAAKAAMLDVLWRQIEKAEEYTGEEKKKPMPCIPDKYIGVTGEVFDEEWLGIDVLTKEGKIGVGNPEALEATRAAMRPFYTSVGEPRDESREQDV